MALTLAKFLSVLKADQEKLATGNAIRGVPTCADCKIPLQESVTGIRRTSDGRFHCSDCYFRELGAGLEEHPISMPRRTRRG